MCASLISSLETREKGRARYGHDTDEKNDGRFIRLFGVDERKGEIFEY